MTSALYGDIRQDGFRLRSSGGYGEYRYWRPHFDPSTSTRQNIAFDGRHTFVDGLLGYQATIGPATVKAFAGLVAVGHQVRGRPGSPLSVDEDNSAQGDRHGAKVLVETWTRLGDWGFLQLDASWSQPFDAASARLRLGKHLDTRWSAGLEAGAFGNPVPDQGRIGAFARFAWSDGEVSVSGGAGGEWDRFDSAYGAVGFVFRF